jgi:hypothetical protein
MPIKISSTCSDDNDLRTRTRDLAAKADALVAEVAGLHRDIRTADEAARRAGFRCSTAITSIRQAAGKLRDTATDLGRIAAARVLGTCRAQWSICPEDGNTLISSGGRKWCRNTACRRSWDYDHMGLQCTEPAQWRVTDQQGVTTLALCDGHALAARVRLAGVRTAPPAASWKGRA